MGKPLSKWALHGTVLGLITLVAAVVVACLFSRGSGTGLDGLGAALAGVVVINAVLAHAVFSTIFVALAKDRSGVAIAHLAAPVAVIALGAAMVWVH